jgi:polyhydroxyalkanoate synthesis regulator phasin
VADALTDHVKRMQAEGVPEADILAFVNQFDSDAQPAAPEQPKAVPSGVMPDEDWAKLSGGEKMRNVLQWGGRVIGGAFMGPAGVNAADNPKTTLATAAIGPAISHAPKVMEAGKRLVGLSSQRAGSNIQAAMTAAKDVPVKVDALTEPLVRSLELQATGSRMPRVVTQLMRRTDQGPLSFREGQDFVSSLSRLSTNERNAVTPQMQRQLVELRDAVRRQLTESAEQVGAGQQYASGVKEYAKAARAAEAVKKAKKVAGPAAAGAAGAGLLYRLLGGGQ